ncbi:MAG: hypothetical protein MSS69_05950 [Spirochaetales bacterium]|nr:hypothetical protein [Spirochaetales bacterium]
MKKIVVISIFVLLTLSLFAGVSSISVPLDSDAYRIIETAELKGIIPSQPDVKPYTYDKVKGLLEEIYTSSKTTEGEKKVIDSLISSFERTLGVGEDASFSNLLKNGYFSGPEVDGATLLAGAKFTTQETIGLGEEKAFDSRNKVTAYIRGELFGALSFYMDFGVCLDKIDHRAFLITDFTHECEGFYMSLLGSQSDITESPFTAFGDGFAMNPEIATSLWNNALSIRFGSVKRDWGPGLNNLGLSESARTFDGFEMTLNPSSWISISVLTGSLGKSYLPMKGEALPVGDSELHANAYDNNFSIQRVEIEPFSGFKASIYESVVWRKRFELAYLNPLCIYMFAQNYIGDFDNVLAGVDFSYTWNGIGRFYAAMALDEFNSLNGGKVISCARNIIALQAGMEVAVPFGAFGKLTLQGTYIPPFFGSHYTYRGSENPWGSTSMATSYVNKGKNLSYPLYPDSVELLMGYGTNLGSGITLGIEIKDQIRSAQYSTTEYGTTLHDIMNYWQQLYGEGFSYVDKDFLSYIWNNILSIRADVMKEFSEFPISLNCGVQCIVDTRRSYSFNDSVKWYRNYEMVDDGSVLDGNGTPTYTENCMKYNPGNGTVMSDDWNTTLKFAVSIGLSLYY